MGNCGYNPTERGYSSMYKYSRGPPCMNLKESPCFGWTFLSVFLPIKTSWTFEPCWSIPHDFTNYKEKHTVSPENMGPQIFRNGFSQITPGLPQKTPSPKTAEQKQHEPLAPWVSCLSLPGSRSISTWTHFNVPQKKTWPLISWPKSQQKRLWWS